MRWVEVRDGWNLRWGLGLSVGLARVRVMGRDEDVGVRG